MKQKLTKQPTGFTQIQNCVIVDKKLSLKGKGLYIYLFSKPDDWDYATKRISEELGVGKDQILTGLRELEECGYLTRKKQADGRIDYYISFEKQPESQNPTQDKKPKSDYAKVGLCQGGIIRPISNTDIESNIEEESNTSGGESPPQEIKVDEIKLPCSHIDNNTGKVCDKFQIENSTLCSHHSIQEVIDAFKPVNESYLEFYGKKTQHAAVKSLIKTYVKNEIMWMIKTAPAYNKMPYRAKGDKIYTPYDLLKNWSIMKDNLISYKLQKKQTEQQKIKEVV